jgi:hypothetical protein
VENDVGARASRDPRARSDKALWLRASVPSGPRTRHGGWTDGWLATSLYRLVPPWSTSGSRAGTEPGSRSSPPAAGP